MKQIQRRKVGAVLGLVTFFALLAVQFSADPCPIHDRTGAHARTSAVSGNGLMCLCFPSAVCAPAESWLAERSPAVAVFGEFPGGRISRLFFLEIFHPPRASFLS